jgi:uncharacterized membrane protein YccC
VANRPSRRAAQPGTEGPRLPAAVSAATPAILFGLRLWASVSLALLIAFWLQLDDASWAGTSAAIVAQPGLGASLRKGRFLGVGTVVGAVAIVFLIAVFPQNHAAFLLSLALWGAGCGYFATILPSFAGYAAALAGYTAAIVFANIVDDPGVVFQTAVTRTIEIGVGTFSATLVHSLTAFGDAQRRLAQALAQLGQGIAAGLARTLTAGPEMQSEMEQLRRTLARRVIMLRAKIDEAIGEPSHLRNHPRQLQAAVEGLFTALSSWRAIATHLLASTKSDRASVVSGELQPVISKVAQADWLDDPTQVRDTSRLEAGRVLDRPESDISARLVIEQSALALRALARAANGLVLVAEPGSEWPDNTGKQLHVPDALPGILNAVRVFAVTIATSLFWIATEWPQGPTMILFSMIGMLLFSPRADAAHTLALEFGVGSAIAGVLAAILTFAVLPAMPEGFASLSIALAFVLVPFGALSARPWHQAAFTAVAVNLSPILSPSNVQDYDASRLLNAAIAISMGAVVAPIFMQLIPPVPPAERARRLLSLTLRDLRRLASGRRRFTTEAWLGLLAQRLAALPEQATLDQQAQLLAGLSVGEASLALLQVRPHLAQGEALDHAFARLAEANVDEALEWFSRFHAQQRDAASETPDAMHACVYATLIGEALRRHREYFASAA